MKLVLEAANSIYPWLSFTADVPSMHDSMTVPMLDIQVWVCHSSSGHDRLSWSFFEKNMSSCRVLKATSGYNWRSKVVTMTMETMRRMRNTSRQVSMTTRLQILKTFVEKLRRSGYSSSTTVNMIKSGLRFYYRKVRIQHEGGPPVNSRNDSQDIHRRRAKMGASQRWFKRRRGGEEEQARKEQGWRQDENDSSGRRRRTSPRSRTSSISISTSGAPIIGQLENPAQEDRPMEATLLVPFTPGSILKDAIQKADDDYCNLIKSRRIRVIESGGEKLMNLLSRNDPWANSRVCDDQECPTCSTRTWIKEERKKARRDNQKLPTLLETNTNHNCRREGLNYTIQCIPCIELGRKSIYRGESSRSARQRHKEHSRDIKMGLVSSPAVNHSIMEHGGTMPQVIYLIDRIEPRPLYRIVRESVKKFLTYQQDLKE